jgi:hypothetical protein
MKRFILSIVLLISLFITMAPAETVHNLLQQNNRAFAPYDLGVIPEILRSNANVFFVDSGATLAADQTDGIHGETPDRPFATLDYAVGKCTADENNIIVVLPYHAESIAAAGVDIDVAGITILGLGYGDARPKFTFTATSSTFICGSDGDSATIKNLTFEAGISAVVAGVVVEDSCDNLTFVDCEWLDAATAAYEFNTAVDVSVDANDLAFIRCAWTSSAAAGAVACIDIGDGAVDGLLLQDCVMYGDYSTACVFSDQALTRVLVDNCFFYDANTDEYGLELQGTSNLGWVTNCKFYTSGNYYDLGGIAPMGNLTATIADLTSDSWTFDLGTNNLDHLLKTTTGVAADGDLSGHVVTGTVLAHIMAPGADVTTAYNASTDSLAAIATALAAGTGATVAIEADNLDHVAKADTTVAADGDLTTYVADGSILSHIMTAGADTSDYQASTDSLEAIADALAAGTGATTALGALNVDHLLKTDTTVAADADLTTYIADGTALAHIMTAGANTSDYQASTDSLEAISNKVTVVDGIVDSVTYYQPKTVVKTSAAADSDDLFDVSGGAIMITNFVGIVTTVIGGSQTQLKIFLDADNTADKDFSTSVDINADAVGTMYTFSAANPAVLTPLLTGGTEGTGNPQYPWFCSAGTIETVNADDAETGAITWYLTYYPLDAGVTVTAQ